MLPTNNSNKKKYQNLCKDSTKLLFLKHQHCDYLYLMRLVHSHTPGLLGVVSSYLKIPFLQTHLLATIYLQPQNWYWQHCRGHSQTCTEQQKSEQPHVADGTRQCSALLFQL